MTRTQQSSVIGALVCFLAFSPAFAGARLVPVSDFKGETGLATSNDVTETMMTCSSYRGSFGNRVSWIFEKVKPGEILASLHDRTYVVKVTIQYDVTGYTITYKDSEGLNYDGRNIHPSYSKWVMALKVNIDKTFAQARADAANKK